MPIMAKKKPKRPAWGERLLKLRNRLDLTQAEAAARIRISQSQWSAFESGARKPTRPIKYLIELLENGII